MKTATAPQAVKHSVVSWSQDYALGLDEIDEQHHALFDRINELWEHLVSHSPQHEVLATLDQLEHYTLSHFTAEETFMRVTRFEGFEAHKAAHAKFVARVAKEKAAVQAGQELSFEVLSFLKDWLVDHILVADKAYADATRPPPEPRSFWGRFFGRKA
jgi:hemerythrin-like metal-binding protein